jgi:hypothetical protein
MRKILAQFPRPLRIFPKQIHLPRAQNGKYVVKLRPYMMWAWFATTRRRGEIKLLFYSFSLNETYVF